MQTCEAEPLFRPDDPALRFLPEGPVAVDRTTLSWVAIQHAADATTGSLCLLDLASGANRRYDLPGRPGFAFATDRPGAFFVGLERHVGLFDTERETWTPLAGPVDADVAGTIINDGLVVPGGVVFGTKDLAFAEPKAALYLYRSRDSALLRLRGGQTCSNGKALVEGKDGPELLDIDTPSKSVVRYTLDVEGGRLGVPRTALDLTGEAAYPDGMVLAPDGRSAIIAFYDPRDVPHGVARRYDLESGQVVAEWRTPGSPRVTCPALVLRGGRIQLLLTTAVEGMTAEQQARHPQAGTLFVAETPFEDASAAPRLRVG